MIHLVHGIHTEGASPVEGLIPYLGRAEEVRYPDYGYILGVETRIVNPIITGALAAYVDPGDVLIGHSNGCAIIYDLLNAHQKMVAGVVFINAALNQNIVRPAWVPWIDVYYNPGDEITEAAEIGARLGITDPVWGEMGHGGYVGPDPKITSINCASVRNMPVVSGHSDFFSGLNLPLWGPYLASRLKSHP